MRAMVLHGRGARLAVEERSDLVASRGEVRIRVEACAVCRTDLHVVDGDLPGLHYPIVPGHEIVGRIDQLGSDVHGLRLDDRAGLGWLGGNCGVCRYCRMQAENLCDAPSFTGYTRDGGFATQVLADVRHVFRLDAHFPDPVATAPLMCAGLIGWRSLVATGADVSAIGLYGFGAAAHIVAQVCRWQGKRVYAFTRPGDDAARDFARELGAVWAGASDELPPEILDAAIIFAPAGELVPLALRAVRKGGRVVCGGIHMTDIPAFPYRLLWGERQLSSIANLTHADGLDFLRVAPLAGVHTRARRYALEDANLALDDLRAGRLQGAAVLVP